MKYTFSKRIDEINISKRGEQLDINILTPRADGYNQIPLLGIREGYDLIMRLPADDISYIDEIKMYLKVENYVKRRNIENTRESITSILSGKQSENNHRRKRIKAGIERAILGADIFVYGQKREIGSISDAGKVIENSLKLGADFRFSKARLLKNPYDESRIKNVLSNSFEGGNILFSINRDLENNQNREAIKEVQKRIELLEKMGKTITLKDLADHFMKAPYGWNVFSVNGLVAELWVYKIIELSESKEIIGDSVRLKEYLTKSQTRNLERIVVNLKEEVDTELIKKVNNTLKELFGSSFEINTDSPKESLIEILRNKKNISDSHLRECTSGEYPGKKEFKEWSEFLEDIILQKNKKTEKFLQEFLKEQDEFYDLYYRQYEVEDFLKSNKKIKFDSARNKIREIRENLGYMGAIQETDPYKELLKITDDKKPYSRIREIDDLLNKIEAEEKKIIEHEKNILKDKAEKERERLERILNNKEFSFDEIQKEFEKFILEIEKANTIKKIMSDNKELENIIRKLEISYKKHIKSKLACMEKDIFAKLEDKEDAEELKFEVREKYSSFMDKTDSDEIENLEKIIEVAEGEKEQFILSADGKTKRKERVSLKRIKVSSKFNIETEKEAEDYIKNLEEKLAELKEEIFKSLKNNKIVDID